MKVSDVTRSRKGSLPPLKSKVLEYLEQHDDEVFAYRDQQLIEGLGVKPAALGFTLWALHRDGLIDKEEADGKVYFGSRKAVADLRRHLGLAKEDPFERARINSERIRCRVGNIGILELLDAVRGPWD